MGHILTGMWVWHGAGLAASPPVGSRAAGQWEQRVAELCHHLLPLQIR